MPSGGVFVTSANSWESIRICPSPSSYIIGVSYLANSLLCRHDSGSYVRWWGSRVKMRCRRRRNAAEMVKKLLLPREKVCKSGRGFHETFVYLSVRFVF